MKRLLAKLMFYWHVNNVILLCRVISTKLTVAYVYAITQRKYFKANFGVMIEYEKSDKLHSIIMRELNLRCFDTIYNFSFIILQALTTLKSTYNLFLAVPQSLCLRFHCRDKNQLLC